MERREGGGGNGGGERKKLSGRLTMRGGKGEGEKITNALRKSGVTFGVEKERERKDWQND